MNSSKDNQPATEFFTPERQQRLDLIAHLIPNSRQPVLLRGPAESGKSYFLKQFRHQAPESWSICTLEVEELAISPLDALESALNTLEGGDKSLQARLVAWSHVDRTLIVIIEDAHDLDGDCLKTLLQLSGEYSCLRLLLSSSENLGESIESGCQLSDLEPFSQKQTSEYAKLRVNSKGLDFVNLAGIDDVVLFIETGGLPGRINDVLAQMQANPVKASKNKTSLRATFVLSAVAASMLVALLLTYGFWSGDEEAVEPSVALPVESKRLPEMALKSQAHVDVVKPLAMAKGKDKELKPNVVDKKDERLSLDVIKQAPVLEKVKEPLVRIKENVIEQKPKVATSIATPPVVLKKLEPVKQVIDNAGSKTEFDVHHAWLKNQPAKHYTLQLLGVSQEASVKQYIASKKALGGLRYFRNKKDNGSWYTVIYEGYVDRESAEKAVKKLPRVLKGVKPWVRSIESVRADMFRQDLSKP